MRETGTRKIVVSIATSADGFIARRDGAVDWLDRPRPKGDYGMGEFMRSIDTILWGRKTLSEAEARGGAGGFGRGIKNYVFSRDPKQKPVPGMEFVSEAVAAFAARLRAHRGKNVWIIGGAGIIGSFLDANEIDEFIIHVVPTFIGEGIPLIAPARRNVQLELLDTKKFPDGVVRLHYAVR